ncbi:CDP-alcohol phosphatidyltransferase family protein [Thalassospiraceae bacterium LMO-JJ14]|nr:CDP-alcohol phosphatidyltransferase family protein [Thalassospiraceae bacterium LMO-JJ14]
MNIANIISLARLLSVPVFVWLILIDETAAAFWLFLAAAISDAVDGIIAKSFNMQTDLGAYLDPIADKTLLVSAYIVLGGKGLLPLWVVIPVVSRDALIVGGALLFDKLTGRLNMEPLLVSKLNTVMQLLLIIAAMLPSVFASPIAPVVTLLSTAVLVTTLVSGAAYVYIWTMRVHVLERVSDADTKGNNREP